MAARAMWKGILNVGKLKVPVKLYSAVQDRSIHFHILGRLGKARVKQRMVNPETEDPVTEISKGYEVEPGSFVVLKEEELKSVEPPDSRDVVVKPFVPVNLIHHQWFDRPYYLGPDGDNESYFALAQALEAREREGIAHWVMRKKRYIGALRVRDGYLVLITLRFAEEILSAAELPAINARPADPRELKMAEQLVGMLAEDRFQPEQFHDEYRKRVEELIAEKAAGRKPRLAVVKPKPETKSLLGSLSASLEKARKQKKGKAVA